MSCTKNYDIKITTILKQPVKTKKRLKELETVLKCNLYLYFLIKQKLLILRRPRVPNSDIVKIKIMFVKATFKDSKKS